MKKYTNEMFIQKLAETKKNFKAIETYSGCSNNIKCQCTICGEITTRKASDFMRGRVNCDKCYAHPLKKTDEDFKEELALKNPTIIPLEAYKSALEKHRFKCAICGYEFSTTADSILRGTGCRKCAGTVLKTNEEFVEKLKLKNHNLQPLTQYINTKTPVTIFCKVCGYTWNTTPSSILRTNGSGCPSCYGNVKVSKEEYEARIKKEFPTIVLLSKFNGSNKPIKFLCNNCNYEWEIKQASGIFGRKYGCPKCAGIIKDTDDFIKECFSLNPNIKIIGDYIGAHNKVRFKCKICGEEWEQTPHHILRDGGKLLCPHCNLSAGELKIKKILIDNNIDFIQQYRFDKCKDKKTLPFDFYLPEYNTCIEFDGIQHYKPSFIAIVGMEKSIENFNITKKHDKIKDDYCKKNAINLIRIPYSDYNIIEDILHKLIK